MANMQNISIWWWAR
ncbi:MULTISPECIES: trpE operon leader peptide TrpLE [Sinorhizobium]|nr:MULTISPECIES: trpE operon leader peptide TrpLE [Sinorhizobium]MDK1374920.1 trpE operon leader peptide TrpLE [Sinorhizobium sp. 6-70]MDK1478384.1 trpE operon leader peptide TrpLE [Sinorhizobium sp. 6-117]